MLNRESESYLGLHASLTQRTQMPCGNSEGMVYSVTSVLAVNPKKVMPVTFFPSHFPKKFAIDDICHP